MNRVNISGTSVLKKEGKKGEERERKKKEYLIYSIGSVSYLLGLFYKYLKSA